MPRATAEPPIVYSNIKAQPINQATLQIKNAEITEHRALQILANAISSPKIKHKYKQRKTTRTQCLRTLLYKSETISAKFSIET